MIKGLQTALRQRRPTNSAYHDPRDDMTSPYLALLGGISLLIAICIVIVTAVASLFRPWMQCFLSGAPIPLFEILAMRLRGSPVRAICEQRIKAKYAGENLTAEQLEKAHQQGADIEKLVDALCLAKRNDSEVRWEDLIATEFAPESGSDGGRALKLELEDVDDT
jgi:uncharacterized protein YqfA (UPF0365 family)